MRSEEEIKRFREALAIAAYGCKCAGNETTEMQLMAMHVAIGWAMGEEVPLVKELLEMHQKFESKMTEHIDTILRAQRQ